MISNERPSPYGYRPHGASSSSGHKQSVPEDTIKHVKLQVERKTFILTLKENPRGRFLRITEDVNGRRDSIIVPGSGLDEFLKAVEEMVKYSAENPAKEA
ncbi:MAG: RNA-binding protein [Verrucomicrobiota bacterium]